MSNKKYERAWYDVEDVLNYMPKGICVIEKSTKKIVFKNK